MPKKYKQQIITLFVTIKFTKDLTFNSSLR